PATRCARPGGQSSPSSPARSTPRCAASPAPRPWLTCSAEDPRLEHTLGMRAVAAHWGELPPRQQKILIMRYYGDMTQAQIGQQLGISQMHVSRLTARALAHLRTRLLGNQDRPPGARTAPDGRIPAGCRT